MRYRLTEPLSLIFGGRYQNDSVRNAGNVASVPSGNSESWGAELEVQYQFDIGLRLYGAVVLLKTKLGDFSFQGCSGDNCDGNQYGEAPELKASFGGEYNHASGIFGSIATSYTGEIYQGIVNSDDLEVGSSFVVDARIGYDFGRYRVSAYANNLLDESYMTGIISPGGAYAFIGLERSEREKIVRNYST